MKAQNTLGAWGTTHTCSADAADLGEEVADGCLRVQQGSTRFAPQCSYQKAVLLAQYYPCDTLMATNIAYRRQAEDQPLCK